MVNLNLSDIESERYLLASMLQRGDKLAKVINLVNPSDFFRPLHGKVYEIICDLFRRNINPTFVELIKECSKLAIFGIKEIGEIKEICNSDIDPENIEYWAKQVKNKSKMRRLYDLVEKVKEQIEESEDELDADALLDQVSQEAAEIASDTDIDKVIPPSELAILGSDLVEEKYQLHKQKGHTLDGLTTGLKMLDNITLGYKQGDLVILGAQTGHGKTAFALHIAKTVSIDNNAKCLYVNTEMSTRQLVLRWGAILSGVAHYKLRKGNLDEDELARAVQSYAKLYESGFYLYNAPNLTMQRLYSVAKIYKAKENIQMLILDYVGRLDKYSRLLTEWQMLEQIVKSCKLLAQQLDITSIVLVQLNEDGTLQGAKRMKNECDLMLKLIPFEDDEREQYPWNQYTTDVNYKLIIEKNRDGDVGQIPLIFDKHTQTFSEPETNETRWEDLGEVITTATTNRRTKRLY